MNEYDKDILRQLEEAEKRAEAARVKIKAESNVDATINQRRNVHGDFGAQAICSMKLLSVMELSQNWHRLSAAQKESLVLIAVKVGRILTGDPNAVDHWHDIGGYAKLVENLLRNLPANGPPVYKDYVSERTVPGDYRIRDFPPFKGPSCGGCTPEPFENCETPASKQAWPTGARA